MEKQTIKETEINGLEGLTYESINVIAKVANIINEYAKKNKEATKEYISYLISENLEEKENFDQKENELEKKLLETNKDEEFTRLTTYVSAKAYIDLVIATPPLLKKLEQQEEETIFIGTWMDFETMETWNTIAQKEGKYSRTTKTQTEYMKKTHKEIYEIIKEIQEPNINN